jgi:hypothetical protein
LLKVILVTAPLLIVGLHLRRRAVPPVGIALALLAAVLILSPAWNIRAMSCTTIGLLLAATWLHDHCAGRRPVDGRLPVLMLLWANLHPGVIAGQGLLLGALGWEWLNRRLRLNRPLEPGAFRRLLLLGGLGLLATFVAPDPLSRLLYPFRAELRHPIMRIFAEMQPLASFLFQAPVVVLGTYLIAALVAVSVILRFRAYRLWEIALLLTLGLLANLAVRGLADWLLVLLALGVPHLAALLGRGRPVSGTARWFCFQPSWLAAIFAALAAVTLLRPFPDTLPISPHCPCPQGAVAFIRHHGLHGKFFAPPNYGSYLGWELGSQALVYVDTRGFFFPPDLLEDSHALPQLGPGWQERLDRVLNYYGTDYLVLETTGPRGQLWEYLHARKVQPLYLDGQTVLLSAAQLRPLLPSPTAALVP